MSVNCSSIELSVSTADEIRNGCIKIWHGVTESLSDFYHPLFALLNTEEQDAAVCYHREADKIRYVIQHGVLRLLLSRQLNLSAVEITFRVNQNGKPYLRVAKEHTLFFNLSNSAGHFLIAIGDVDLGVDLEKIAPAFEWQDIAARYFCAAELDYINKAPNPTEAFFLLWTRKEALLKACGMGIDDNLPGVPALDGLHHLPGNYPEKSLQTRSFTISPNLMAGITYPSTGRSLTLVRIDTAYVEALL